MLFHERSVELKVALIAIWAFPYLTMAITTRSWRLWVRGLFKSTYSPILFCISFLLLTILLSNFGWLEKGFISLYDMLARSFADVVVIFHGLVLVIISTFLVALFRPTFPYDLLIGGIIAIFHMLYLMSLAILILY